MYENRISQLESELQSARRLLAVAHEQIAQLKANEENARHSALHDELTALPNRAYFRQRVDRALGALEPASEALAVLYLDLDGFKLLNDTHGHDAGDAILKITARRMAHAFRTEDVVSRLGGDEFACLLIGVPTLDHLAQMARKLLRAISMPVQWAGLQVSPGVSIGIASYPFGGRTTDTLLKSADSAMYQAKRQNIGYAFCKSPSAAENLEAVIS